MLTAVTGDIYNNIQKIYWLAEFGDVSCLPFNYLRVETLTPTWEDLVGHLSDNLVGHLSDNFKSEVRQNSVSDPSLTQFTDTFRHWPSSPIPSVIDPAHPYLPSLSQFTHTFRHWPRSLQVHQRSNTQVGHWVLSDFTLKIIWQMSDQIVQFGDVSCLQFNYLRVETLTPTWEDLVGHLSDNLVGQFGRTFVGQYTRTCRYR
jgi:hypothetical protein